MFQLVGIKCQCLEGTETCVIDRENYGEMKRGEARRGEDKVVGDNNRDRERAQASAVSKAKEQAQA